MASIGAKTVRDILSRRIRSVAFVTALLTSSFFALAMSQNVNEPSSNPSSAPTATILSPFAALEPSTQNNPNDKDGYPPTKSEADPEEIFMLGQVTTEQDIYDVNASLVDYPVDGVNDLTVDNDAPRNLDMLDGVNDGKLAAGTYYVYWNVNKTGYVPVNTTPGSSYNGSNSASISIVDDVEGFKLNLNYRESEAGPLMTAWSDMYTTTMWKSASIGQNDLEWLDTEPKVVFANVSDVFTVRSKYQQSSAQGLDWLILQSYYNGRFLRMKSVSYYFYNDHDPGSIVDGVPAGSDNHWDNKQQFTGTDLGDTDNKDFWVTEYTFEIRQKGFSDLIPYIQTKKGGDTWKIDTGYREFRSRVPGGVNPARLEISKYFSENYAGGVVSGPNPPVAGMTTTYELSITVGNVGSDPAINVVVTDVAQTANVTWLNSYTVTQGSLTFDPGTGGITWSVGTLAINATATLSYRVSITPTPEMVGQMVPLNAGASATGNSKTSGETITAGPTEGLYTEPVTGFPEMTFTKTADQTTADPGDDITYTLHYANVGSSTAYSVVVEDTIPDHVAYVSSSPPYTSVSGMTYTWSIGQVPAGASGDVTITVNVDAGTPDDTVLSNLGKVEYTNSGGESQPPEEGQSNVTVTAPVMTFDKTVDVTTADPGDLITYTLSYHNTGTGNASGVVIKDTIPEHVTFISSSPSPSGVSGRVYTFSIGNVPGGGSGTITIVVKVDAFTPDGTVLANTATLDYDDANGNSYPQETDGATTTVTAPVVTFDKSADVAYADPGDLITYTLTAHNSGTGSSSGVVLKDTIPEHTTFYSASPNYNSVSGRTYTWNLGTLAPGETKTVTLKVKVDTYTPDGTVLANTATLDYADANGNAYPQLSDSAQTTVTAPVMAIFKTADVGFADPGDLIVYTITYVNEGNGHATGVVVTDTIPDHTTYVSSSPLYDAVSGRTYTWNVGTVGPGGSSTITVIVEVDAGVPDQTVLTNQATLDYDDANGNPYPQLTDSASTTVTAPVMTFTKTADVTQADPGDMVTYTLHYKNTGTGLATSVVVRDTIPADTSFFDASPWYSSVSGRTYTWNVGTVGAGGEGNIVLKVKVNVGTADGTVLLNTATLDYNDANGNPYPQLSDDATTTVTAPVMSFTKDADVTHADPGDTITYTLTYHNGGTGWATGLVVIDTIPDHVTFQTASPWYDSVSGKTYTWNVGNIGPGVTGTITVTVKVDVGTGDQTVLTNTATLDYADANGNAYPQLSDSASTSVTAPVMTFTKTADMTQADPGDTITYTLHYENTGTGAATGVIVKDTIPLHVTFVSSNPAYTSVSGRTYEWDVGTVNSGVSGTITVKVEVDAGTPDQTVLTNTATFDYADANGNQYSQKSDSATTTVTAPVMTFTKVADVESANPGDVVTFTLEYKNVGTGMASLVVVEETLPNHMTFVDATPYPDSVSGNVLTWYIGDVSSGTTATIVVEARIDAGTPDGTLLHNVATLDYADANGNYYPQLTASCDVTTTAPVMSFTKSADVTTADPGDEIVYTLHYANTGSGKATGVVVVDTLPDHVTFVTAVPYPDSIVGNVLTWDVGTVNAYTSGDITITVNVDVSTDDGTFLVNSATLDYNDANGNPYPQLSDDAEVTVTAPILHLSKVADVQKADPSDYITYTIAFYNSGSGDAAGVVITDTIPEHVAFVSSTPTYDEVSGMTYKWNVGTVAAGDGGTITVVVQVDVGTPDATLLHNLATLDYTDANGNPYEQLSDDADVTVTAPVVELTKTADADHADPSDYITYTVQFTNSGGGNATDVFVNDTIPAHVTFVSSDPDYLSVSGRTYTWHWDLVLPGDSVTVKIVVKVDAYTADQTLLHNVATMDYADDSGNPYPTLTAYADVVVTAPVFTFEKNADRAYANPGDEITYTLTWENAGTGWARGVYVVDTIPSHADFVYSTPDYTEVGGNSYDFYLGDVGPGAYGQIIIVVKVRTYTSDQEILHNAATLDFADANGNYYPQLDDYADVVVTAPVMSFTKVADASEADPGDFITYSLCYENSGTGVAANVIVSDTLPDRVTFIGSTPSPDGQEGNTLIWNVGTLGGGGGACITIVVQVEPGTADRTLLHNIANLNYADANGNPYTQIDGYWDTRVTAPIMTFSKSADVSLADPGDVITYTLQYENSGSGSASGVTIVDTLPVYVTFISASVWPTSIVGQVLTWNIGDVGPLTSATITVIVAVNAGTPDKTLLHNAATLDYSDANGNFIEQLGGSADVTVTAPVMTFDKDAGNVTVSVYVIANFTLRIAGEKWHDVVLTLYDGNTSTAFASVTRYPGSPDDQSVTLYHVRINLLDSFRAIIVYTPLDDPINGNYPGDNPCWLTLTFPDGDTVRLFHNFNINHNSTWIWIIDDFTPYLKRQPVINEASIPYTLTYENIGTGDASNVVVTDTFEPGSVIVDSNPPYDSCIGNVCTWNIGNVVAGGKGYIFVNITYIFDVNNTIVTNNATLDYSDANGNFIEQLSDSVQSILIKPEIHTKSGGKSIVNDVGVQTSPGPYETNTASGSGALLGQTPPIDPPSEPRQAIEENRVAHEGAGDSHSVECSIGVRLTARTQVVFDLPVDSQTDAGGVAGALSEKAKSGTAAEQEHVKIVDAATPLKAPADTSVSSTVSTEALSGSMGRGQASGAVIPFALDSASMPPSVSLLQARAFVAPGNTISGRHEK